MATFSQIETVSSANYSTAPDIVLPFPQPKRVRFCNMDGGDLACISFDGVNDAGTVSDDVKSPSSVQEWQWQFTSKIWLRTLGNPVSVQVVAES